MNLRLASAAIVLVLSGILLGAGVYESVVLAPNLQGAPTSLEHARGFYHLTNPGVFFRVVSPATQLFLVVAFGRQLEVPGHAIASGCRPRACDSSRRDHLQISLSPERRLVSRSDDRPGGRLRSVGGRMGRGKLCSYRPDFDRRYFGHDFGDPHRTRDRSRTPVVLMRDLRRFLAW